MKECAPASPVDGLVVKAEVAHLGDEDTELIVGDGDWGIA